MIGTTLSHFKITAKLGEGGMGEVYRAEDTKLDREVAIKVLPEALTTDPERLARFEREAKVLASLNHPNIAGIHQIEEADGQQLLVMELVEGEDLADLMGRGAVPVEEAVAIAQQVTQGLEAAHERGIVHRDLKPANIKITPDRQVKILDFGLAKAHEAAEASPDMTRSPTLTAQMTQAGMILGTAAYMSPEQARGQEADPRSDIWSLGVVLVEMLSGARMFAEPTVSDTLAAVLRADLDWDALPDEAPRGLRRVLRRCLERDPKQRYHAAADVRIDLEEALGAEDEFTADAPAATSPSNRLPWWFAAAAAILFASVAGWALISGPPSPGPTHLSIALPYGHSLTSGPAISPDGQAVAFVSTDGIARPQLYVRLLSESEPRLIADTQEANQPFFSPDSRSVAFYARAGLFKVSLDGGAPVRLADSASHEGGAWMDDGRIVFNRVWNGGFYTVPENGGSVELLAEPDRPSEYAYVWPDALPGSRQLLFSRWGDGFALVRLDLRDMTQTVVSSGWRKSMYVPTGHLIFGAGSVSELWALPYGDEARDGVGPVTVAEQVDVGSQDGDSRFDISDTGTLVYTSADRRRRSLAVVSRLGRTTGTEIDERAYSAVRLSPTGRRVAVSGQGRLAIVDMDRATATPLVPELDAEGGAQDDAIWSPDGSWVTFSSNHEGNWEIYSKAATGVGSFEPVLRRPGDHHPYSYAPDGTLLFSETHPDSGNDLWLLPDGQEPEPWLVTDADEDAARFSPDGRLVAFVSNASGRFEVYVQTRATDGERVQVSATGGGWPVWSPDGDRLYFRQGNAMMEATVNTQGGLSVGSPQQLFDGGWELSGDFDFEVMPDGESFLMIRQAPEAIPTRINLILNWFDELERRVSGR